MKDDTQFIETVVEAINDVRRAKGNPRPIPRDIGFTFGLVLLKRLEGYGFVIEPPQRPLIGGVLQGARRGK